MSEITEIERLWGFPAGEPGTGKGMGAQMARNVECILRLRYALSLLTVTAFGSEEWRLEGVKNTLPFSAIHTTCKLLLAKKKSLM